MNIVIFIISLILLSVDAGQSSESRCLDGSPTLVRCTNQSNCDPFGLKCISVGTGKYCCASPLSKKIQAPIKRADASKPDPCKPDASKPDASKPDASKPGDTATKAPIWDPIDNPNCKDDLAECPKKLRLCLMLEYERLMRKYCMKTCNFCDELPLPDGKVSRLLASTRNNHFECFDSVPDCKEKSFLCNQFGPYRGIFIRHCLKTCDIC